MNDVIRPEQMDPPAVADGNYQTSANATDNRAALQRWLDALEQPYSKLVGSLSGEYGWRLGPNGEGLNLTNRAGVTLRGVAADSGRARSALRMLPGGPAYQVAYDFTGTRGVDIDGVDFNCDDAPQLNAGFLMAGGLSNEAGRIKIRNSTLSGNFRAGIYTVGVEKITLSDDVWIVVNGSPPSSACIWATNDNPLGLSSNFTLSHANAFGHAVGLTIEGGFLQNAAAPGPSNSQAALDAYGVILSGVTVVNLHHVDLIAREAGVKVIGAMTSGLITIDRGTRFSSNDGGFLRYAVRQDSTTSIKGLKLDMVEASVSEALFGATTPIEISGLEIGQYMLRQPNPNAAVPVVSMVGPFSQQQIWNGRINCQDLDGIRHPIYVGGSIRPDTQIFNPPTGGISAPNGNTAQMWV